MILYIKACFDNPAQEVFLFKFINKNAAIDRQEALKREIHIYDKKIRAKNSFLCAHASVLLKSVLSTQTIEFESEQDPKFINKSEEKVNDFMKF